MYLVSLYNNGGNNVKCV